MSDEQAICEVCYQYDHTCLCKKKRLVDKKLCESYQGKDCAVCDTRLGTVGHHVKSKGGGGHDAPYNLMPLCMNHHREIHDYGLSIFVNLYPTIKYWLRSNDWSKSHGKWKHYKNN